MRTENTFSSGHIGVRRRQGLPRRPTGWRYSMQPFLTENASITLNGSTSIGSSGYRRAGSRESGRRKQPRRITLLALKQRPIEYPAGIAERESNRRPNPSSPAGRQGVRGIVARALEANAAQGWPYGDSTLQSPIPVQFHQPAGTRRFALPRALDCGESSYRGRVWRSRRPCRGKYDIPVRSARRPDACILGTLA